MKTHLLPTTAQKTFLPNNCILQSVVVLDGFNKKTGGSGVALMVKG